MTHVPSRYNYIAHTRFGWLCWNTVSGALLHVGQAEAEMLAGKRVPEPERLVSRELFATLRDAGMLVPADLDERAMLEQDMSDSPSCGIFRILTTTACNATCDYCYERGLEPVSMDGQTARSVAEFIATWHFERNASPVLEWFGGEPLLNHRAITDICRELRGNGVRFTSKMSTNGSLWTDGLVHAAKHIWNLQSAQVTLDGTELLHERTKHLPAGTYKHTLDSCQKLIDQGIWVKARINHLPGRTTAEHELIEELSRVFRNRERFEAYVVPAYRAGTMQPEETMREVLALERQIRDAGIDGGRSAAAGRNSSPRAPQARVLPRRRHSGCFMCSPGNFTIAPDGRLYNCSHAICESQCVGTVRDYSPKLEHALPRAGFLRRELADMCRECTLLPVCMGGCRVAELGLAPMTQCLPAKSVIAHLMEEEYRAST